MKKSSILIITILILLSAAFSSYSYRSEKPEVSFRDSVCNVSWGIAESSWNGKEVALDCSRYRLVLGNDQKFTCTDVMGKQYTGDWLVLKHLDVYQLVLNPGTSIEERYKVLNNNRKDLEITVEKIHTPTGEANVTYTFAAR